MRLLCRRISIITYHNAYSNARVPKFCDRIFILFIPYIYSIQGNMLIKIVSKSSSKWLFDNVNKIVHFALCTSIQYQLLYSFYRWYPDLIVDTNKLIFYCWFCGMRYEPLSVLSRRSKTLLNTIRFVRMNQQMHRK